MERARSAPVSSSRMSQSPPEVLSRLMEDPPPLPSPAEVAELKQQTADMLDFPEDMIRELAERSNAKQPTPEQLDALKEELEQRKALLGESECKAVTDNHPVFPSQALTHLRLLDLRLAIVLNFGRPLLGDGIERVVNGL